MTVRTHGEEQFVVVVVAAAPPAKCLPNVFETFLVSERILGESGSIYNTPPKRN